MVWLAGGIAEGDVLSESSINTCSYLSPELGRQRDGSAVVIFHCLLYDLYGHVWLVVLICYVPCFFRYAATGAARKYRLTLSTCPVVPQR